MPRTLTGQLYQLTLSSLKVYKTEYMLMSYVGEAHDGLPNHPVPQKARGTMTNLRTRLKKTSSSGHPLQIGTMFPALKHHSQAPCTYQHIYPLGLYRDHNP